MNDTSSASAGRARLQRLLGYLETDPGNARLRADAFDTALAAGEFDEAGRQARHALERTPADAAWRTRLARLHLARGEWDSARGLLDALLAEQPGDPVLACDRAYADFGDARFAEAEARLAPLVAARFSPALALAVSCRHRLGEPGEAVALFEAQADGAGAAAVGAASLAALDADMAMRAAEWSERALALDPRQQEALVAKATLLVGARDAQGALALLAQAVARAPEDGRVLSTAALAQMLAGRFAQARALYEQAVAAMPGHIGTWLGMGWCAVFMRDLAAARAAIERALAIDERFGESHGLLAVVEALEGRREQAEESIRRARGLDRRGLAVEYARAILDGEAHDLERLRQRAERVLSQVTGPDGRSLAEIALPRRP